MNCRMAVLIAMDGPIFPKNLLFCRCQQLVCFTFLFSIISIRYNRIQWIAWFSQQITLSRKSILFLKLLASMSINVQKSIMKFITFRQLIKSQNSIFKYIQSFDKLQTGNINYILSTFMLDPRFTFTFYLAFIYNLQKLDSVK